jgi:pimeloyl-ACP methyl ester carboxylesterase
MPTCRNGAAELYYEVHGSGYPVFLIAPGGMRSAIPLWERAPWNPVAQLAAHYQVIVMDQRNAGRSSAPIAVGDGWDDYLDDQLAVLDHLGVEHCHVGGMCIGGSFVMGLLRRAEERFSAALLFQTIGLAGNRDAFYQMYDGWAEDLRPQRPEVAPEAWDALRHAMYDGDFLFTVDRAFVAACQVPLLVLAGDDLYHPKSISLEIARSAPRAELLEDWKTPAAQPTARAAVERFLAAHTPVR